MFDENIFKLLSKRRSAIMGISAIWILMFHYTFYPVFSEGTFYYEVESFLIKNGNLGVDFFFFLSGFGLLYSIEKNSIKKFYYNRFKRLIIPYTFAVIIFAIDENMNVIDAIKGYVGYSFIFENIYATPWFVPAIAILYLLFPIYYKLFQMAKNKSIFTISILTILMIMIKLLAGIIRSDSYGFLTRIPVFLVGVLFGYYSKYDYCKNKNIRKINICLFVSSILFFGISIYLLYLNNCDGVVLPNLLSKYYLPAFLLTISSSLANSLIFSTNNIIASAIENILSFIGKYSFEIYCLEDFCKSFIYAVDPYVESTIMKNIIMFIVILATAYIFNAINNIIIKKFESLTHVQELL